MNAVEAMRGSGSVRIGATLERSRRVARRPCIAIADDGPGIEPEVAAHVFDLFYTTKATGAGVGLAMARRLVERQGGTIAVDGRAGQGATFLIRLAVSAEPATVRRS